MALPVKFCVFAFALALLCIGSGDAFFFFLKSLAHIGRYDDGDEDRYNFVQPTYGSKATVILFCSPFSVSEK